MKLVRARLSKFRSFSADYTELGLDNLTFLLGPNGAGKTAVLQALARMFSLDPAQRKGAVAQLQVRLADELPTIPLYMRRFYWLYNSSGYTPMNTFGGMMNGIPLGQNKLTFLRR